MIKNAKSYIAKPNKFVYKTGAHLSHVTIGAKGRMVVVKEKNMNTKGGFLLLCNHLSEFDYMTAVRATYPATISFVVSSYYFHQMITGNVLRMLGAIPKLQFQPDVPAIKKMMAVAKSGGIVGLYPEGQVCTDGNTGYIHPAIGKLIKVLDLPVVCGKVCGTYLIRPKWAKRQRRGKIEFGLHTLLTQDEVRALSVDNIYQRVVEAMAHDDIAWASENRYAYKGRSLSKGLENILYLCPSCKQEYTLETKGNKIFCTVCKNTGVLDYYGKILAENENAIVYPTVALWKAWQKEQIAESIHNESLDMHANVALTMPIDSFSGYKNAGVGVITATKTGIQYTGTCFEKEEKVEFSWKSLINLPCVVGENFEVPTNNTIYCFYPESGKMVEKWVELCEVMREMR